MSLSISIPDDVALHLGDVQTDREQRAREAIALELYREGRISLRTMGRLVGLGEDYWAADAFRVRHGMPLNAGEEDAHADEVSVSGLLQP